MYVCEWIILYRYCVQNRSVQLNVEILLFGLIIQVPIIYAGNERSSDRSTIAALSVLYGVTPGFIWNAPQNYRKEAAHTDR